MKSLIKMLKPIGSSDALTAERFSFRIEGGVEIFEHEYVRNLRAPENPRQVADPGPMPRLIVQEAGENGSSPMFSKKGTEIFELMQLLRTAVVSR